MDKEELFKLSKPTVEVYNSIEEQILVNIAKRLKKHQNLLDNDIQAWQTNALNEVESLTNENIAFLRRQSGQTEKAIRQALEDAGYGELMRDEKMLQELAEQGRLNEAPPMQESGALQDILSSYERQAHQSFNLINTTMLDESRNTYVSILNQTTGQVLAGVKTSQEALRDTVSQWADDGIPALIDRRGRKWSTEAYVSTVMRSTTNNVANEMQDARLDEYGVDLVEVSSYPGARPKCFEDQGKVYSMSGQSNKFPAMSSTSYGQPDGLFGVNCSHTKYPYIDGISRKAHKQYGKKENERIYENSQKQRYLERQIRKGKRELRMFEELGDQEGIQNAKRKIRDRQANLRGFIDETGRTRRRSREQIY